MRISLKTTFRILLFAGLMIFLLNPLMNLWMSAAQYLFGYYMPPMLLLGVIGTGLFTVNVVLAMLCSIERK